MTRESPILLAIGAFLAVMAAVYWFVTYEDAGTTMLVLASGLNLFIGGWLWLRERAPAGHAGDDEHAPWFPHASLWPFWIGVASFFLANGLLLGSWFLIPGGLVLGFGIAGFAAQSRSRRSG